MGGIFLYKNKKKNSKIKYNNTLFTAKKHKYLC